MNVLITGASGTIGRFIAKRLMDDGHKVTALARQPVSGLEVHFSAYDLDDLKPKLPEADVLVHCALVHVPGKFRSGEGDDPDGFWQSNVEGSKALFAAAKANGFRQVIFLSSRAVYGDHRKGETLLESDVPTPDTLYGRVKLAGEEALKALSNSRLQGTALRPTGVYGTPPGLHEHKWSGLFEEFLTGARIEPRVATEVHGEDVASAVSLLIEQSDGLGPFEVFNVSDVMVDRRTILSDLSDSSDRAANLPQMAESRPGQMDAGRLRAFGWAPGGLAKLKAFVRSS